MAGTPGIRPKTYTYQTRVEWVGFRAGQLHAAGKPSFRVASPPEFKGEPGVWSPEDLFVASVNICTMTTFLSFAERAKLVLTSYASTAEGTLELVEGSFRFTRIVIKPQLHVPADQVEQAQQLMHDAHAKCLVSNSMRCVVEVEATVNA
ncbi:MAG: OsmC family protein [Candidatus Thermoplasmatota archaeon]